MSDEDNQSGAKKRGFFGRLFGGREAVGKGRYDKQIEPDEVKAILAS